MSLVGTRPPTLDEWEKYELHHRARLAVKPGITGMWQVSGRSDITDFEEVVKLDKDTMSVRVPDGFLELHRSFKIHSKQFVYETLIGWGLNPEKTYSFKGEYLEEQKMVVFSLKNTD